MPPPLQPLPGSPRLHGLDALRALAMFLGVVLHAALSFLTIDAKFTPRWDDARSGLLDIVVFAIHSFRMQAFFLVAGYLAALALARRSLREFAAARALRVALPLAVGAVTIVPLTIAPFLVARNLPLKPAHLVAAPAHLWFLIYLLIFSIGALAWRAWAERRALGTGGLLARMACARWAVPGLIVPTAMINLLMPMWIIETPWGWLPSPASLLYYALFFSTGFALHRAGRLQDAGRPWLAPVAVCVLLPALIVVGPGLTPVLVQRLADRPPPVAHMANAPAAIVQAAFTWAMILGLLGVLDRVCREPRAWVRWLADSSYWVYLTHLPIVYFLQLKLVPWSVPGLEAGPIAALVKFALILAITLVCCLASYALLVRPTVLERVIGGGRGSGTGPPRRPAESNRG